jgi:hypothetical protein
MTTEADFTPQEWEQVLQAPPSAGLIVITAQRGGTFRETVSIAKAYVEARRSHGQSELLDEIVAAKPEMDHTRYSSLDELKQHSLANLRSAVALLSGKVSPQELDEYKRFIVGLSETVASAHREGGRGEQPTSDTERTAIAAIVEAIQ